MTEDQEDNLPDYEVLIASIRAAPLTWLPGLCLEILTECDRREVFAVGGLEATLRKAKQLATQREWRGADGEAEEDGEH